MDAFVSRKRRRESTPPNAIQSMPEEESTDVKLAILSSLNHDKSQDFLLDILLSCNGSVEDALALLEHQPTALPSDLPKKISTIGVQRGLSFVRSNTEPSPTKRTMTRPLTKKGKTLFLYRPEDIANHTPCSIIHNFLPSQLANDLLLELLPEAETFESATFKLFDNVVKSPHTACFYVDSLEERNRQKSEFLYNGSSLEDIREILPVMRKVSHYVKESTNKEIQRRIQDHYPEQKKLRYQSSEEWLPNAAFVNCYDGPQESVGYHSDQLTYLGPRCVIASLSLGVAREFRVRKIVAKDEDDKGEAADASGQISIHLPHNSLLVMHAETQEEYKHSVAPAQSIDPHPIAGNKRINITYRWYREQFNPQHTPKCRCGTPTVLKTVQKQKQNRGRYMWMCQTPGRPDGGAGCGYFEWAEFTDDGEPIWKHHKPGTAGLVKSDSNGVTQNCNGDSSDLKESVNIATRDTH